MSKRIFPTVRVWLLTSLGGVAMPFLTVAAAEVIGDAVTVVKFRPMSSLDWSWSQLGRTDLHSSHLT